MIIKKLELENWMKILQLTLDFQPGINLIYGPNEIGKSSIIESINQEILLIGEASSDEKTFAKQLSKSQGLILKQLEKELKIVPKNYYRMIFMSIGMAGFGIPLGVAFGLSIGNLAFLGLGLPIGLAIGIAIGTAKDSKAKASGNQLEVDINY